jgi:hypothetical protein
MSRREVKRVLVILDYGPGDPNSGEVFDLTALAEEMRQKAGYSASVSLDVRAERTYAGPGIDKPAVALMIAWGGYAGEFVHGATHIEDVVNSALPDGERVKGLRTKAKRLRKKAEEVDRDAMVAKLIQVGEVRSQHPIARVKEGPDLLEAAG